MHDFEPIAIQARDLEIGREYGGAKRDGVPRLEQAVLHQRVEDVADGGGGTFDCEEVVAPAWRLAVAHFLHEILVRDALAVHQHAIRDRIVVTDDAVGQLVHERVGVEVELLYAVVHARAQQRHARLPAVTVQECAEALSDVLPLRHAAQVGRVPYALGFLDTEPPQREECLPWRGCDPVRVAAPGVEHLPRARLGLIGGQLDQFVLQFEGAQLLQLAHLGQMQLLLLRLLRHRRLRVPLVERRAARSGHRQHDHHAPADEQSTSSRISVARCLKGGGHRARTVPAWRKNWISACWCVALTVFALLPRLDSRVRASA